MLTHNQRRTMNIDHRQGIETEMKEINLEVPHTVEVN